LIPRHFGHGGPFQPGGIAAAASPPQTAFGDLINHFGGFHLVQGFVEGLVAPHGDVFLNAFRVQLAAVFPHDLGLAGEEGVVGISLDGLGGAAVLGFDNAGGLVGGDFFVEVVLGINLHQGPPTAEAHTTNADHFHLVAQLMIFNGLLQVAVNPHGVGGPAAGGGAAVNAGRLLSLSFCLRDFLQCL
jgi:hypothetical protein